MMNRKASRRARAPGRRCGPLGAGALLAGVIAPLLGASPAFGHAKLLGASPAAGAQVAGPPASLTLRFNEAVRLAVLKLSTAGHAVPVSVDPNAAAASSVTIVLPPLAAGAYDVAWSALTPSDGHVVKGTYSFVVRANGRRPAE